MLCKYRVWVKEMCVVHMAGRRREPTAPLFLCHPAGVRLPLEHASDADLIFPEVRQAIVSGTYSADLIRLLPDVVQAGDCVLVIGAGVGVVATLIAKDPRVKRVLALEANTALIPYLDKVHALNGVPWVETVNAVPAVGARGRVPFFARGDLRTSSLLAEDGDWQQVMLVPLVDLDLIIAEEAIDLIVCEIPTTSARAVAEADLGRVERLIVSSEPAGAKAFRSAELATLLTQKGFAAVTAGGTILFDRDGCLPAAALKGPLPLEGRSAT